MEFLLDRECVAGLSNRKRKCRERGLGIAGVGELFGDGDTRRVDDLLFQRVLEAGTLQRLDGGNAVGSEFRFRNRDGADIGFCEVVQSAKIGPAGRPDYKLAACVDGAAAGNDKSILDELIDMLDVSGEEDVEGCAVFDLLGQLSGRAEAGHDVDFSLPFEGGAEIRQDGRQVGGRGDVQLGALGECSYKECDCNVKKSSH